MLVRSCTYYCGHLAAFFSCQALIALTLQDACTSFNDPAVTRIPSLRSLATAIA